MHEYDDIDRALFALPLETPPQGLREAILRSTVHAPRQAIATVSFWESIAVGVTLALAAWLTIVLFTNPAFAAQTGSALVAFGRALADPATLSWLAVGASATLWLSFVSLQPIRVRARSGRT
jgi:hypothetical protein